jgi:hypothetical protein
MPNVSDSGLVLILQHPKSVRRTFSPSRLIDNLSGLGVTNNVITSQVASGLVKGLFPQSTDIEVVIQSPSFDSLEPTYPCNKANSLKNAITTGNSNWTNHLTASADLYAKLDSISGIASQDTAGWHSSFDQSVLLLHLATLTHFNTEFTHQLL